MSTGAAVEDGRCIRVRRTISAVLDGEASTAELLAAASHLGGCPRCRQFVDQVVAFTCQLRSTHASLAEPST
jgi:predicted anti-sigma-YlaC factor YlaD